MDDAGESSIDEATPGGSGEPVSAGDTPLTRVLDELDAAGWSGQFMAVEGGSIRCLTCREQFDAAATDADEVRRLEGASDPADMVLVVRTTCPHCETRGVLVAHYGPEASGEEADVVAALPRTPATGQGGDFPAGTTT